MMIDTFGVNRAMSFEGDDQLARLRKVFRFYI